MATSAAVVTDGYYLKTWDVTADADGDTDLDITHGMASAPEEVTLLPLQAIAYTSAWAVDAIDGTDISLKKTAGGGGDADPQVRVQARIERRL